MLNYQRVGPVNKSIFDAPDLTAIPILEWFLKKRHSNDQMRGVTTLDCPFVAQDTTSSELHSVSDLSVPEEDGKFAEPDSSPWIFWERRICPSMFPYLRESDILFVRKCRKYPNRLLPI